MKEKEKEKESDHLRETPKTNLIIIHQWRSALEFVPSPPPPLQTLIADDPSAGASNVPSAFPPPSPSTSFAYSPSLLIIASIIAFVIAASASIHLLLRHLSRQRSLSPPPLLSRQHPFHSSESSSSSSAPSPPTDRDRDSKTLIDSLPLFTLASSLAAMPKSSPDCAVCLSPFAPDDELRLLPACRHAFHAPCIDAWLPSTPSCPLCRSPVTPPIPPPDLPTDPSRSSSFRLEIGSVSRRRYSVDSVETATPHARSYSIGSSFEYLVADEVDAVVSRVQTAKDAAGSGDGPPPPGDEVAAEVGGTGRGWMREYVDRIASSASSSFSSLRLSSCRFDGGGGGGRGRRESWDMEVGDESAYYASFYRWLVGASS